MVRKNDGGCFTHWYHLDTPLWKTYRMCQGGGEGPKGGEDPDAFGALWASQITSSLLGVKSSDFCYRLGWSLDLSHSLGKFFPRGMRGVPAPPTPSNHRISHSNCELSLLEQATRPRYATSLGLTLM